MQRNQPTALGFTLILIVSLIALSSSSAAAAGLASQDVVNCRTISSPGVHELTSDIVLGGSDPCFVINAGTDDPFGPLSPIILEGNGHTIRGTFGILGRINTAIQVQATPPGGRVALRQHPVIIRNVGISGIQTGIAVQANNVEIRDTTILDARTGIAVGGRNNRMIGNTIVHSSQGVVLSNSRLSQVSSNTIVSVSRGAGVAIALNGGSENTLEDNTVTRGEYGIRLDQSHGNTLIGNTANNNRNAGIRLVQSTNNLIQSNTANANDMGISIGVVSGTNDLIQNIANENRVGIMLSDSAGTDLIGNILCRNSAQPLGFTPNSPPATETGTITNC